MGLSLWAMYQGIICILLINILIAMMNTTFMKVWENVDGEWKFSKSHFQVGRKMFIPRRTVGAAGCLLQQRRWRAAGWKISTTPHPCHLLLPISGSGSSE